MLLHHTSLNYFTVRDIKQVIDKYKYKSLVYVHYVYTERCTLINNSFGHVETFRNHEWTLKIKKFSVEESLTKL